MSCAAERIARKSLQEASDRLKLTAFMSFQEESDIKGKSRLRHNKKAAFIGGLFLFVKTGT